MHSLRAKSTFWRLYSVSGAACGIFPRCSGGSLILSHDKMFIYLPVVLLGKEMSAFHGMCHVGAKNMVRLLSATLTCDCIFGKSLHRDLLFNHKPHAHQDFLQFSLLFFLAPTKWKRHFTRHQWSTGCGCCVRMCQNAGSWCTKQEIRCIGDVS